MDVRLVVVDPATEDAAVAKRVVGKELEVLVVELGVGAGDDGRLEVVNPAVGVADQVAEGPANGVAHGPIGKSADDLLLQVPHCPFAPEQKQHTTRQIPPLVGLAE